MYQCINFKEKLKHRKSTLRNDIRERRVLENWKTNSRIDEPYDLRVDVVVYKLSNRQILNSPSSNEEREQSLLRAATSWISATVSFKLREHLFNNVASNWQRGNVRFSNFSRLYAVAFDRRFESDRKLTLSRERVALLLLLKIVSCRIEVELFKIIPFESIFGIYHWIDSHELVDSDDIFEFREFTKFSANTFYSFKYRRRKY